MIEIRQALRTLRRMPLLAAVVVVVALLTFIPLLLLGLGAEAMTTELF